MSHTPGPESREFIDKDTAIDVSLKNDCGFFKYGDAQGDVLYKYANAVIAHHIASAPELKDSLEKADEYFTRCEKSGNFLGDEAHEVWTRIKKALAKSTEKNA